MSRPAPTLLAVAALALLVSGCRGRGFDPSVRREMSAEARCPEDKIQVKALGSGGYQAEGCGKTAIYDCSWPEGGARTCTRRGSPAAPGLPGTSW